MIIMVFFVGRFYNLYFFLWYILSFMFLFMVFFVVDVTSGGIYASFLKCFLRYF
jgi:hypothetical protein